MLFYLFILFTNALQVCYILYIKETYSLLDSSPIILVFMKKYMMNWRDKFQ